MKRFPEKEAVPLDRDALKKKSGGSRHGGAIVTDENGKTVPSVLSPPNGGERRFIT